MVGPGTSELCILRLWAPTSLGGAPGAGITDLPKEAHMLDEPSHGTPESEPLMGPAPDSVELPVLPRVARLEGKGAGP